MRKEGNKMKSKHRYLIGSSALAVAALLSALPAKAQGDEIIVTAQKREENINTVPMSITAATGEQLRDAGVTQVRDLVKLTPGLTHADSGVGTPVYTIRGIGFDDIAVAGRPAVTVYSDQAPIPFALQTRGVILDLERVEVLKGPQGTLFGTNTTGGAINFVAAKPTSEFEAGADLSYGRFNSRDISAFISGPISSTLAGRIAIAHEGMDEWQQSFTTGEELGAKDFWNGRAILDWTPSERLKASLTLSGWIDRSDTQAQQLIGISFTTPFPVPELIGYPLAPRNPRAADFDVGRDYSRNNDFYQGNLRVDYDLADDLTITSLTSYSHHNEHRLDDLDGTTVNNNSFVVFGELESVSQELRLAGRLGDRGNFTIGGFYADDNTTELYRVDSPISSVSNLFIAFFGADPINFETLYNQDSVTKAVFGSFDYDLTDDINIYGGVRYTDFRTDFNGCLKDSGDGVTAAIFSILAGGVPIMPGACVTILESGLPGEVTSVLDEDNVSWRAGAQWTVAPDIMLYANVSKGFKAGSFPSIPADSFRSFAPVTQESVLAYEAGFKAGLSDGALQFNGAFFYYDYTNKQLLGNEILPGVGLVSKFLNIPESRVVGGEFEIVTTPVDGLRISASGTYVDSEVTGTFFDIDPLGNMIDFRGEAFPNTPKWQLSSDVQYTWAVSDRLDAFLGGNVYYQSDTNSDFGEIDLFRTDSYALLDLRAGIETNDGRLRASLWGRNVTNTYYWSAARQLQDANVRFVGMPATYGATLSVRY